MVAARQPEETGQQTLIEMHHPEFKRGYQEGRNISFQQEAAPLTDKQLIECLAALVQEGLFTDGDEASDYYTLGQLIGQLSGAIIPRQPYENDEEARKQRVLAHVRATSSHKQEAERRVKVVTTLWIVQDFLASHLDADTYEDVLYRGILPTLKLVDK
jgi:hypothetical protein